MKQQSEFESWREDPPEEYKKLFAEIEMLSGQHVNGMEEAKQLGREMISSANTLEALAEEFQQEADRLRQSDQHELN